jgi:phosphoenolpyruvate phosphomutase
MTEMLEAVKRMVAAVELPVIADCDNGFGNAINVMRTVEEYERAGVAGVCIEDNVFPKRCSFYPGVRRELVAVDEHASKIRAAKDACRGGDFVTIARTEALIAGWGKQEALKRARAYAEAGADAVLVHSKSSSFDELREFSESWDGPCPLVAVPTTYAGTTAAELAARGFKMVIFANQALRAAVAAMRGVLRTLRADGYPAAVEKEVVPLEDIYGLVGLRTLQENERRFLTPGGRSVTAVIIAAGFTPDLMPLVEDRPKGMLDIKGQTILERQVRALNDCGIKDIVVVRGYRKEQIQLPNLRYYDNDRFLDTGEAQSLFLAEPELRSRFVFLYGDIVFDPAILEKLLKARDDITVVVDRAWADYGEQRAEVAARTRPDLVVTRRPPLGGYRFLPPDERTTLVRIGQKLDPTEADGEFIGLAMFSEEGAELLRRVYAEVRGQRGRFHEAESVEKAAFTDLIQELIDRGHDVACIDTYKGWMEIDTFEDYRRAWAEIKG